MFQVIFAFFVHMSEKPLQVLQISHPILSCSMASIFSARAMTPFIISFSSSVRSGPGPGPGCMVQLALSAKQLRLHCFYDFTKLYLINTFACTLCLDERNECALMTSTYYTAFWIATEHSPYAWCGYERSLSTYCSLSLCHRSHIRGKHGKQGRAQRRVGRLTEKLPKSENVLKVMLTWHACFSACRWTPSDPSCCSSPCPSCCTITVCRWKERKTEM